VNPDELILRPFGGNLQTQLSALRKSYSLIVEFTEFPANRENNREFFLALVEKPHKLRVLAKTMHKNRE